MSIVIRITITTVAGVGLAEEGERKKSGGGGKTFGLLNFTVWLLLERNVSWTCLR